MRYRQQYEGEWVYPRRKRYFMRCCDCGLVHIINFKLVKRGNGKAILFQAFRQPKKKK